MTLHLHVSKIDIFSVGDLEFAGGSVGPYKIHPDQPQNIALSTIKTPGYSAGASKRLNAIIVSSNSAIAYYYYMALGSV